MPYRRIVVGLAALAVAALGVGVLAHPSGTPIRSIAVRGIATTLAVDAARQRAFILTIPATLSRTPAAQRGHVDVLDLRTESIVRTVTVGWNPIGAIVDERAGRVFVLNNGDSSVSLLDARSGALWRTTRLPGAPQAAALDARADRVYVSWSGARDGVSVLSGGSGRVVATIALPGLLEQVALDAHAGHLVILDAPPNRAGHVDLLNARTGALVRTVRLGQPLQALAIDERTGHALVIGPQPKGAGVVSVIDTRTGRLLRRGAVGRYPWAIALDARSGHAFVSAPGSGNVAMLDAASGRVARTTATGVGAASLAVDGALGRVVVANMGREIAPGRFAGTGSVSVLDARTGALRRTLSLAGHPLAVAVNERGGQALLLTFAPPSAPVSWSWLPGWLHAWLPFAQTQAEPASRLSILDLKRSG